MVSKAVVAGTAGVVGVLLGVGAGVLWMQQFDRHNDIRTLPFAHPLPQEPWPREPDPQAPSPALFEARADEIVRAWPDPGAFDGGGAELLPLPGMDAASPEDTSLTVHVGHGACDTDFGAWLRETEELVIVGGWNVPDPTVACTEQWLSDPYRIGLESELGDRPVVDAVSGAPLLSSR
ncbi:hypothetical protein ACWGIB_15645 [Streptomyces xiamenensis]